MRHPKILEHMAKLGGIQVIDDTPTELEAAKQSMAQVCSDGMPNHYDLDIPDHLLSELFSANCHGVMTDLMFGDEPKGILIALKAIKEGFPCVIVSRRIADDGTCHLPRWVTETLTVLRDMGVKVFQVDHHEPKAWGKGYEAVLELSWDWLLKQETRLGDTIRRIKKFEIDLQPADPGETLPEDALTAEMVREATQGRR